MNDETLSVNTFSQVNRLYNANMPILKEWTNKSNYYLAYPTYYRPYAEYWLRPCLQWFDGYVPEIHNEQNAIISTKIGNTLCRKVAEQVFGGGLLFNKKGVAVDDLGKEEETKALKFISGEYKDQVDFDNKILQAFTMASAGGTSYIKENVEINTKFVEDENGQLEEKQVRDIWIDVWRADKCYCDFDYKGKVIKATFLNAKYTKINKASNGQDRMFYLIEERFYATKKDNEEYQKKYKNDIDGFKCASKLYIGRPYVVIKVKELQGFINNDNLEANLNDRCLNWDEIPKDIKDQMREQFGIIDINRPAMLPLRDLGVKVFKWTPNVSNLPDLPFGESMLANIQAYLYEYDFMNSSMNTDMYLARGRVMMPKALQNPQNRTNQNFNQGMDSFLFTQYDSTSIEEQKPTPIQFELRSQEWTNLRNHLLENMASNIGIASSTLASFLNDGSNRTAREISSEESATSLFVENKRKLLVKPINDLIDDILLFYGYKPCIIAKFSKSGQTNTTLLIENTTSAFNSGLMSKYLAVKNLNPDMSADELDDELARIEVEAKDKQQAQDMFGFNDDTGAFGQAPNGELDEQQESAISQDDEVELADNTD